MTFSTRRHFFFLLSLICLAFVNQAPADSPLQVKTVFIILMENHNWSLIKGATNCPYINHTLLPMASYCEQYYNPPANHPSEPNYLWLEAGTNFGILNDSASNRISSTNHLVTLLNNAGISWKSYQEDLGTDPLINQSNYVVRHDPVVFFNDVNASAAYRTSHVRPYAEFAGDLQSNAVARYNFITPNLTNDMHTVACSGCNTRVAGDYWLSHEIPKILASQAFTNNGAIFIVWDEGTELNPTSDGPLGMIVLSRLAKGRGYSNSLHYTHSSTLRTMQNIFGVRPYLGDAAKAIDLSDLFVTVQFNWASVSGGSFVFGVTNLIPGRTSYVQTSSNLIDWSTVQTLTPSSSAVTVTNAGAAGLDQIFYRLQQAP